MPMSNVFNKTKYIILYFLSFTLIVSALFILSGCAPVPVLNKSSYDNNNNNGGIQKKLEKEVMAASLGLNGVSNKRIKLILYGKPLKSAGKIPAVSAKPGGISGSPPLYRPSFMVKTYNISGGNVKHAENRKITVDKTIESPDGRLILKVKSVEFKNIFEIVNISIKNLHSSAVKYRLALFKSEGSAVRRVSFKSNAGSSAGSYITGHMEIKESIVFVKRQKSADLTLAVPVLYKNRFGGGIKFVKLIYKFARAGNIFSHVARKNIHGENWKNGKN